jgi:branched-chain amino acid transport system ATP-binding protein
MTPLLSVSELSKSFGAIHVAKAIAFDVAKGEILGIIGPNGAGKTTLFGMLSGQIAPSAGCINFDGKNVTEQPPHARARAGIARTYQVPRPFGQMTVTDNLRVAASFAGGLRGIEATGWIAEVLALTGLQAYALTQAGRLPLLVRKRHELARALAMKPKLLLIDEVAAGLTEAEVGVLIDIVRGIRAMGTAIVWIEHVIRTMLTATDRLLVLADGEVLAVGEPRQVIERPDVKRVYLGA